MAGSPQAASTALTYAAPTRTRPLSAPFNMVWLLFSRLASSTCVSLAVSHLGAANRRAHVHGGADQRVALTGKSWFTHGVPAPPKQLQSGPLNWIS